MADKCTIDDASSARLHRPSHFSTKVVGDDRDDDPSAGLL